MNQFGDELMIVEDPGAPLLLWIQLLVVVLLLSLISRSATLLSPTPNLPSSSVKSLSRPNPESSSSLTLRPSLSLQVGGGITRRAGREAIEASACAAERIGTGREEDGRMGLERRTSLLSTGEEVCYLAKKTGEEARRDAFLHPCNFVRLAGMALIKCFGLDPK